MPRNPDNRYVISNLMTARVGAMFVIVAMSLMGLGSYAQNINLPANFPDPNFRSSVESFMGVSAGGSFTAAQAASKTGYLQCAGQSISSIAGVEYFPNITRLYCQNNNLASVDLSNNTQLVVLYIYNNNLSSLDLSNHSNLEVLSCYDNAITTFDLTNCTSLRLFYCLRNQITSLDLSDCTQLNRLHAQENQLSSLDISSNLLLEFVYARDNQITTIQVTDQSAIKDLDASYNLITDIASMLSIGLDPAADINIRFNNLFHDDWSDLQTLSAAVGGSFLYEPQNNAPAIYENINTVANFPDPNFRAAVEAFMGVAPGGIFTAPGAAAKTGWLNCAGSSISSASGIAFFPNITRLYCQDNSITELDLSNNTELVVLYCYSNNLTDLTVSGLSKLEVFSCYVNSLTSLDLSGCTSLRFLYCFLNQLESLNISDCSQLIRLHGRENQLTSLDISNNSLLEWVYCQNNLITDIQVTDQSAIKYLNASYNQLASISSLLPIGLDPSAGIDIRHNELFHDDWADLQTLDASVGGDFLYEPQNGVSVIIPNINTVENFPDPNFRAAVESFMGVASGNAFSAAAAAAKTGYLNCAGSSVNSVTGIEYFPNIKRLYVQGNNITSMDLSNNSALQVIYCAGNNLTSLQLTNHPALEVLSCYGNALTTLDVSGSPILRLFYCSQNQLSNLDLSANTQLAVMHCFDNQLTSLDLSNKPNFTHLSANNNQLQSISFDSSSNLVQVLVSGNSFSSLADFVNTPGFGQSSTLDIRNNLLSDDDISDIQTLETQIGAGFLYTVNDLLPPQITCPSDMSLASVDPAGLVVNYSSPIVSDLIDPSPSVECVPVSGSLFPLGDTIVNCTATDSSGNTSNCQFVITITDGAPPTISLTGNSLITLEANVDTFTDPGATAFDLIDGAVNVQVGGDVVNSASVGTYVITYNSIDAAGNNAVEVTRTVQVIDTLQPVISCPSDIITAAFDSNGAIVNYSLPSATDIADSSPTVICEPTSGSLFAIGSTIVNCTAIDFSGNISNCSFTVQVSDSGSPVINCPVDQIAEAQGAGGAVVFYPAPTVFDSVDPNPVVTTSPEAGSLFSIGSTIVYATAIDSSNNVSSCQFVVQVVDTTAPDISCSNDVIVEADNANGSIVNYALPAVFDIVDSSPIVICEPASGSVFAVGDTVVECTAVDSSGNVSSCQFVISVNDTTSPVIVAPNDVIAEAQSASGAVVSFATPIVTDLVDPNPTVVCDPVSGSVFSIGLTIVDCTATDASGNIASTSFTVEVNDTIAPAISCPGDVVVEADNASGAAVNYALPVVTDSVDSNPIVNCEPASGSLFALGSTIVNCTAIDFSGNVSVCSFTIQVLDTGAPQIDCPVNIVAEAQSANGANVNYPTPVVFDSIDPNPFLITSPESGSIFALGSTTVYATAIDSSNNVATCQFIVQVTDTIAPQLNACPEDILVEGTNPIGDVVIFSLPSSTDLVDASPVVWSVPQSGAVFPIGATVVSIYTQDFSNNVSSCTLIVEVTDTTPPVIVASGPASVTLECNQSSYDEQIWQASVSDLCDPNVQLVYGGDTVDASQPGVYTVLITATDVYGNVAIPVSRTVTVQDTIPPVISGADDAVVSQSPTCDYLTSVPLSVSVTDSCDASPTITTSFYYADGSSSSRNGLPYSQELFPIGVNVVTVQAVDGSQNVTEANFFITVISNTQIEIAVFDFISGVAQPVSNAIVKIYDSSAGSCADLVDGVQGNGVPSGSYNTLFFGGSCSPDYDGVTSSLGQFSLPVYPGEYVVLAAFDTDNSGTIDSNDEILGESVLNLTCGESRALVLKRHPFSLFALHSINLGWLATVEGDIATQVSSLSPYAGGSHEIFVNGYSTIEGTVCADSLYLGSRTRVKGDVVYNNLDLSSSASIQGAEISTLALPLSEPAPMLPNITEGSLDVTISSSQTQILAAGTYGNLIVQSGSKKSNTVLQLNSGVYTFADVNIGNYARVEFLGPCEIRIKSRLYVGYRSQIIPADGLGLSANDSLIVIEGQNGSTGDVSDSPKALSTNSYATIHSRICAINGAVRLGSRSNQKGLIISKWIMTSIRVSTAK